MPPDRDRERRIVETARQQGRSDDFIRQAIIRDRERRQQPQPMPQQPQEEERGGGFLGGIARAIAEPVATLAVRPLQLGRALTGATPEEQAVNVPFLGRIEAPTTARDVIRDVGRVAETAALGIGGGAATTAGRQILGQTVRGAAPTATRTAIRGGVRAGALGGGGAEVARTGEIRPVDIGVSAGVGAAAGGVLGAVGGRLGEAITRGVARRLPVRARGVQRIRFQDALDITRPRLTKGEQIQAVARGRGEQGGIAGFRQRPTLRPSRRDEEVARSVQNIVRKNNSEVQNIQAINNRVTELDQSLVNALERNNAIFNRKQLATRLNKAKQESRVIFAGDKALENRYNAVINELMRNIRSKNISGLFRARKDFDAVVRQKFPRTFSGDASDNVTRNAILDVRREVNEFIASRLPAGNEFKEILRTEHLMLEAAENIAENAINLNPALRREIQILLRTLGTSAAIGTVGAIGVSALR